MVSHFTAEECVCVWREAGALVLSSSLSPSDIKHGSGGLALHLLHSHTHKNSSAAQKYTCAHTDTRLGRLHINTLARQSL